MTKPPTPKQVSAAMRFYAISFALIRKTGIEDLVTETPVSLAPSAGDVTPSKHPIRPKYLRTGQGRWQP